MLVARRRSWRALKEIAARITPGMTEESAVELAADVLSQAELRTGWHRTVVRLGRNTLKSFDEPSESGIVLKESDIFFVDIGPVFRGHESDVAISVAVGADTEMKAAASDVRKIWEQVRRGWKRNRLTGADLYGLAEVSARQMGWVLNLKLKGHRLSEYPHRARYDERLADVGFCPAPGLWVLEIQIRHPRRDFGAFFEDLLLADDQLQAERNV